MTATSKCLAILLITTCVCLPAVSVRSVAAQSPATLQAGQADSAEFHLPVSGYSEALAQITAGWKKSLTEEKLLIVWLFDESANMKDDQEEIRRLLPKVFEELVIPKQVGAKPLQAVFSYGEKLHALTRKPTADLKEIETSIDNIPIDSSGKENLFTSLSTVVSQYGPRATKTKRKLLVIVVTDESGDDGQLVEDALAKAKRFNARVSFLGRQAIFGSPYARVRWMDPKSKLNLWLRINRGPETAFPETLQFDGLGRRRDSLSSGFGPYEQLRMAKETEGKFLQLPSVEEDLSGRNAREKMKRDELSMKEYIPELLSRHEYTVLRQRSKFRATIWQAITTLNPYLDQDLNMRRGDYAITADEFRQQAQEELKKAVRAMGLLNQAIKNLESVKPLREKEKLPRWRANYDLMLAQCHAYRVRLYQLVLALHRHAKTSGELRNRKSNVWRVVNTTKWQTPDEGQRQRIQQALKSDADKEQFLLEWTNHKNRAKSLFQIVMREHPATPWARQAEHELRYGFGIRLFDRFRDPKYSEVVGKIKLPSL